MKKIVIVGGGVAGMTAGVYAQLLGFSSVIIEKNAVAGGQCTGWDRQGFHTDGCIHWLCGTKAGSDINKAWRQVGALGDDIEIINLESLWTYAVDGVKITLWQDLDKLERELIAIAPEDKELIIDFIKDVRSVSTMEMPIKLPVDMMSIAEMLKMGKAMSAAGGVMNRKGKMSCLEFAKKFESHTLRRFFETSMPEGYSISSFIFSVGMFATGQAGIPKGGSRAMAMRMAERYKQLGGELLLNTAADEIVIQNDVATGVKLANGELISGDYVLAACDAGFAFNKLLRGKYHDKQFEMRFENEKDYPSPTSVMITYGVDEDVSDMPVMYNFECEPFKIGEQEFMLAGIHHYGFEKSFAPEGKTVMTSTITLADDGYRYFEKLSKEAYRTEKQRIAEELRVRIEKELPRLAGKLTVLDVATPMTYARFCNARHGAWMSFMMTTGSKSMMHKGEIKGLKNCFITGQWLQPPGGLPTALSTGKASIQRIAKREKMNYIID